jgi:hypothetical protein
VPYTITLEPNGAYKKFSGHVTATEFMQSINELHGSANFDDLRFSINDFQSIQGFEISDLDVKKFAGFGKGAARTNPNVHIAVITSDERIKALVRIYATPPLAPFPLAILSNPSEARDWLFSQGCMPRH